MPQVPKLAPKFTLNLIDGDQRTLRFTVENDQTGDRVDLTGAHAALQVRKALGDATVILTLATAAHPGGFTSSSGCEIALLDQTADETKGQMDATIDLDTTELTTSQFTDEGGGRYTGVFDLEVTIDATTRKYARGTAVFRQEVTEPAP